MPKRTKSPATTRFRVGDKVRVRYGVMDYEYPDMPLGGWAGTISEIHDGGTHLVRWTEGTLDLIHPVFKIRCENDGMYVEQYSLDAEDLEPDTGGPLNIEQPQQITTRPLSPQDQDDRIRMIFGLTSNDVLPAVDEQTLSTYYEHLSKHLVFPFTAEFGGKYRRSERVKVISLGGADEPMIDDEYGVLCEVQMEGRVVTLPLGELDDAKGKRPSRQLIADYCYWLHNFV